MSNSRLISGTLLTNNCTKPRNHKIDTITPHYMCWFTDARTCCESFLPPSRKASANYCIGKDGEIWLNVEEQNRAWTTGSGYNDNRAITIECANYADSSLPVATWDSLIKLCVDICKRNNIPKINYTGNTNGNLTMHKWYQDTDCPGKWLSSKFPQLAKEINARLKVPDVEPTLHFGGMYRCTVNGLRIRTSPTLNSEIVGTYDYGETINLDDWYISNNGYIWGRYVGITSGQYRYVAVGRDTGKIEEDDFLIKI